MRRLALTLWVLLGVTPLSAQEPARSNWIPRAEYNDLFERRSAEGLYPDKLEGDCQGASERFRVTWTRAAGAAFVSYALMSREFYERQEAGLRARGYQRKAFNEFKDCSGKQAFQATWIRPGSVPRKPGAQAAVAVQSEWIPRNSYQEEFDKQVGNGFYPAEIKAECQGPDDMVRVLWRPLPPGVRFISYSRMSRDALEQRDAELRPKGYERKWAGDFRTCKGEQRYVAVWMTASNQRQHSAALDPSAATAAPLIGGWLTSAEFRQEFERRAVDGLYPAEIQGRCQKGAQRYRATWKERPAEATIFSYVGMSQELYERRDTEFRARGFERVWAEQLGDCAGAKTHQATWLKPS